MQNGEDDSEVKRSQDLIETVAPPGARRATAKGGALRGVLEGATDLEAAADAEDSTDVDPDMPLLLDDDLPAPLLSPDEIPTERPPWTDPAESRERLVEGVPAPPVKKNA